MLWDLIKRLLGMNDSSLMEKLMSLDPSDFRAITTEAFAWLRWLQPGAAFPTLF